ncbi:MAG TPA: chemotaxis protein CheB [Kofleriaceae bacterium]|nr:chemotaxis protein CheB [Kofleriaceae bacterium]
MTLRVVIVEDSPIARAVLKQTLEEDRDIAVVGMAEDDVSALRVVKACMPDLVTMDIQMAGAGGLGAIEQIMAQAPVPILVVTALPTGPNTDLAFEALRRGALDVAAKPSGPTRLADAAKLRRQVRSLAGVPVVRHVAALRTKAVPIAARMPTPARVPIVGIAASAGGPIAVAQVLAALPARFAGTIAVVQHLPKGFAAFFAAYLQRNTTLDVVMASDAMLGGIEPRAGLVVVAPDDRHLVLGASGTLLATQEPPESNYRPAASVLFRSLARFGRASSVGVVLTGIGDDGAEGLLAMRRGGALTIAQDAATSAVFGMPRAAITAGAATRILPIGEIAQALVAAVS